MIARKHIFVFTLSAILAVLPLANAFAQEEVDCGNVIEKLQTAAKSGDKTLATTMSYMFSKEGLAVSGLDPSRMVSCVYTGSGRMLLTVNSAVAAGISAQDIKTGVDRKIVFKERAPIVDNTFYTAGKSRFEFALDYGVGNSDPVVGITTSGENVTLSGGGGYGITMSFGYGVSEMWDFDVMLGYKASQLDPEPEGVDGQFSRATFMLSMKYRIRVTDRSWVKLGAGLGYFIPLAYEMEDSTTKYEIDYGSAPGGQVTVEYETALGGVNEKTNTFVIGIKYYTVTYDAEEYKENGVALGVAALDAMPDLKELDGQGVDLTFGWASYF